MRDTATAPAANCCLVRFDEQGSGRVVQLTERQVDRVNPTSEVYTHLLAQQHFLDRGMEEKAFMHTHVTELIALTQIREFCQEEKLNHLLWGMHPETLIFIPEGIGFVPHSIPGTREIGKKTLEKLENHKVVVWEKHGCLAAGKILSDAFDLIDLAAKAAAIWFLCRRAGFEPEGLTKEQLLELRKYPPHTPPYQ
jgi:rhamnulose-1-phosphate aldolase